MLLIDGVRYNLWTPPNEDEFERVVVEHAEDIFGENSIYLDRKQKLKSLSGIGSIPDGYVIVCENPAQWHIVEVELSTHPLHEHIVSQVSKFINGIKNPSTQRDITNAIYSETTKDEFMALRLKKETNCLEIHKFLSDLISKPPILTIIIEADTEELREAISTLNHPQIKVVEFQTFVREGAETVHSHVFEPVQLEPPRRNVAATTPIADWPRQTNGAQELHVTIRNSSFLRWHLFYIPRGKRSFFPGYKIPFSLETDIGTIETHVSSAPGNPPRGDPNAGAYIQANLAKWYRQHVEHGDIKLGDKVIFKVIEPMKKYRLEIVK